MVGRFVGAGARVEAARVTARIVTLELFAGIVLGALMLAALPLIRDGFSSDPAVRDALTPALIVLALSMPINAVVFGIDGALIGAGDGAFMRNSMVAAAVPACVVLFVLMALGTTLIAIWLTVAAFLGLRLAFMIARIRTGKWLDQAIVRADGPTSTAVENPSAAR
jgi:Na+-driven multidrug efflux pump